jgi:nucleotide-binding universal stress UspA family protein
MRILFATDGEKHSSQAIELLKRFKLGGTDEIKVVSVVDMAVPMAVDIYGGYLPDTTEFEQTARENATRVLDETAGTLRTGLEQAPVITTEALFGSPDSRIVEAANEFKPDLVVVGSHGYSTWERLLLGSVSDSVLHHVPCSVLVVRSPEE